MRRIAWGVALTVVVLLLVAAVLTAIAWPELGRTIWRFVHDYRWWLALAVAGAVAVFLLRWLLGAFLGHQRCSPWRAHVRASADTLKHQLTALPPGAHGPSASSRTPSAKPSRTICGPPASSPPGMRTTRRIKAHPWAGSSTSGGPAPPAKVPTSTSTRPRSP